MHIFKQCGFSSAMIQFVFSKFFVTLHLFVAFQNVYKHVKIQDYGISEIAK